LVRKPEEKGTFGRPRCRWEDCIRMDLRKQGEKVLIHLAQERDQWQALVSMVMKLKVPQKMGNFLVS
jgi:hypothetical protein